MVGLQETLLRRVTIAVIGLGEMGTIHAKNLSRNPNVHLALASQRPSHLERLCKELDVNLRFSSYDDALNSENVDGVVVATPFGTHSDYVRRALLRDKKVLVEKPLGVLKEEVRGLANVVDGIDGDAGLKLMIGFQRRWDEVYGNAWKMVRRGTLGRIVLVKGTSGDKDYPEKYWRDGGDESLLRDLAVHDIDMARWLYGEEITRVYVVGSRLVYEGLAENKDWDTAIAVLEMEGGGITAVHLSRCLNYGYNVSGEVVGEKGSIRVGSLNRNSLCLMASGNTQTRIISNFAEKFGAAFRNEADAFVRLVQARGADELRELRASDKRYAGYKDGLHATLVADALVESVYSGAPVEVKYDDRKKDKAHTV